MKGATVLKYGRLTINVVLYWPAVFRCVWPIVNELIVSIGGGLMRLPWCGNAVESGRLLFLSWRLRESL